MAEQIVDNYEQFIKANFTADKGAIVLRWIEDTDVSDTMSPEFKKKILKLLREKS